MLFETCNLRLSFCFPNLNRSAAATGSNPVAVASEGYGVVVVTSTTHFTDLLPVVGVVDPQLLVKTDGGNS